MRENDATDWFDTDGSGRGDRVRDAGRPSAGGSDWAPEGLSAALGSLDIIEKAQVFVWHGRRYCWYDDGWQGPGFYRCGYAKRHGLGWGGGAGWHGWRQGVQPERRQQQDRQPKGNQNK